MSLEVGLQRGNKSLNEEITIDQNKKTLETWTWIELGRRMGVADFCCFTAFNGCCWTNLWRTW